ncbi:MAG: MFS transporter [Dehalococcoidia bacterium]|nr:MFS transporter [Dehalococcoidia bacterium]
MPSGHPPSRDYMKPDVPKRVRDYMAPTPNGNGNGAHENGNGHSNGHTASANGNGSSGIRNSGPTGGVSQRGARRVWNLAGGPAALVAGDAAAIALPAPAAPFAPPQPRSAPEGKKGSLAAVFVSFKLRDFRYLTLSTLAAGFAQWAKQIALFALIFDMTGSAVQLGTIAAFRGAVGALIAPYGGYLAERYARKTVIIWSTALDGVLAAALAVLVLTDRAAPWHVYAIAFGGGLAQSINQPARQALVYDVTTDETLPNAIAMNSMVQNISRVTGPSAFGMMMGLWGVGSGLVALTVLQITALLVTMLISSNTRQVMLVKGAGESTLRQIAEGFKYSWSDKRILGLILISTIPSLLVYPYIPFLKVVSEEVLHRGTAGFGWLSSMMGWGSLIGLFFLAYVGSARNRGRLMIGCFILYTALLAGFSASSNFYLSLLILATAGIPHGVAMAINQTLIQQHIPSQLRGRVMAVFQLSHAVQPLGSFPMAFAIAAYGAQFGIGIFMVTALVAFALFAVLWTSVRRMD